MSGVEAIEASAAELIAQCNYAGARTAALTELAALPASALPQRGALYSILGRCQERLGQSSEACEAFRLAEESHGSAGEARAALKARLCALQISRNFEPYARSRYRVQQCLAVARREGWGEEEGLALLTLASTERNHHHYEAAIQAARLALRLLDPGAQPSAYCSVCSCLAWALMAQGNFEEGDVFAARALELLRSLSDEALYRRELVAFSFQLWCRGDIARAREQLSEALALCQRAGQAVEICNVRYNLAVMDVHEERFEEARKLAILAWQGSRPSRGPVFEAAALMLLSLIAVHQNQVEAALNYVTLAQRALTETGNDEAQLLHYYCALAQLAAGNLEAAGRCWAAKAPLEPGLENLIEARWLIRALGHLRSLGFRSIVRPVPEALEAAKAWQQELERWLRAEERRGRLHRAAG